MPSSRKKTIAGKPRVLVKEIEQNGGKGRPELARALKGRI